MTIDQAIKKTGKMFSTLYKKGEKYQFKIYNPATSTWFESAPMEYQKANLARSRRMAEYGRDLMGLEPVAFIGGYWTQYLKP
jgi:hypothetical protein